MQGMFQMLNQGIQASPLTGRAGTGLLDSASMGLGGAMGTAMGQDPYSFMTPAAKANAAQRDIGQLDLSTSAGLMGAADIFGRSGQVDKAMQMSQAGREQQMAEQAIAREQKLRESLAKKASDLGLTSLAEQIATGGSDLKEDAKVIREQEVNDMLIKRGAQGRKAIWKRYGLNEAQFNELGAGKWDDQKFGDFVKGLDAELKPYVGGDGVPKMYKINKSTGQVYDPAQDKWVEASELALKPAPHMQKVLNVSNKVSQKLAEGLPSRLDSALEAANSAQLSLDNINRSLPVIESMPTGIGAPIEAFAKQVADYLGLPQEDITNYEVFIADAGQRVMSNIKAFGSGSAISDADREYAKLVSAASPSAKAESLKILLRIQKAAATTTIDHFNTMKAQTRAMLPEDEKGLVDTYQVRAAAPPPQTGLSDSAKKWFE